MKGGGQMLFIILAGKPYYVAHGTMYPVTIEDDSVTIHEDGAEPSAEHGRFTLAEIRAKCGDTVSSKKKTRKKKTED